jgi:hypothetical protein
MRHLARIPVLLLFVLLLIPAVPVWRTDAAPANIPQAPGRFVVFEAFMRLG